MQVINSTEIKVFEENSLCVGAKALFFATLLINCHDKDCKSNAVYFNIHYQVKSGAKPEAKELDTAAKS